MRKIDAYFERKASEWNWLAFGITVCLAFFAVSSMLNIVWLDRGVNIRIARVITAAAFVLGWLLSRYERRWWLVIVFSFLLGGLVIASQYARVGDEFVRGFEELIFYIKTSYTAWRNDGELPSTFIFMQPFYEYAKGMFTMLSRLGSRLLDLPATRRDGLARVMLWELGLWMSIIWANWSIWRKSLPLLGPLPGLLLGGYVIADSQGSTFAYLFMFGFALVVLVLYSQQMRENDWERNRVGYSEYIREHSTRAALYLAVGLVFGSGMLASIDFEALIERVREYRQGITGSSSVEEITIGRRSSIDEERRTLAEEFDNLSGGGFPMVNLIGTGPELAEHVVLHVEIDELDPASGQYRPVDPNSGAIYLRALNYEQYNSRGWFANTNRIFLYDPGQEAVWAFSTNQRLLRQDVSYVHDFAGLLTAVGQLAVVDLQYTIAWRDGSSPANFKDMVGAMVPRSEYRAYSLTPSFSEEELRNASVNYPDWVNSRYLELPSSVPERVLLLAEEIAGDGASVYDQAIALENYLRRFPYTLDLPDKPEDQDIVDYFLFDIQRGYCDYYASSMVVMARHLGIPARLAVGYVTRNYDEEEEHFIVTADQAHSWVEIYFPGYGWVTFEPTSGREAIARVPVRENITDAEQNFELVEDVVTGSILNRLPMVIGISAGIILIIVVIYLQANLWWLRRKKTVPLFATLYKRIQWFADQLEIPKVASSTPHEFSNEYRSFLAELTSRYRLRGKFITQLDSQVAWLTQEYVRAVYSPNPPGMFERARALREWPGIRRRLGLAVVIKKLSDLRHRLTGKRMGL